MGFVGSFRVSVLLTSAKQPHPDFQTERMHRIVEQVIRYLVAKHPQFY